MPQTARTDGTLQATKQAAKSDVLKNQAVEKPKLPLGARAAAWAGRLWRPVGSAAAVCLALLLGWHVINGKHGLQVWQQKRIEDRQLQREIQDLSAENARLKDHIAKLKADPQSIEHEAREKLHYAKPGEVIYTLPADETGK